MKDFLTQLFLSLRPYQRHKLIGEPRLVKEGDGMTWIRFQGLQ